MTLDRRFFVTLSCLTGLILLGASQTSAPLVGLPTTSNDFIQPGSQPRTLIDPLIESQACYFCHGGFDPVNEPYELWAGTMMANATRDPIFHAAMAIANQDAQHVGEICIRCHSPLGFTEGRAQPADGSALRGTDYDGVTCNFCHRLVDPVADPANPVEDAMILANVSQLPLGPSNAQYILDDLDRRRGPFDLGPSFLWHGFLESPYHRESALCGTCHDVSNPAFDRMGGATPSSSDVYRLNAVDTPHPTHDKYDQFPLERTFSEWAQSAFAQGPVDMGGRFGGNKLLVSTCQDCHMEDASAEACRPTFMPTFRNDMPRHLFAGANSWVPEAIYRLDQNQRLYGPGEASQQPLAVFQAAQARNVSMLQKACDLAVSQSDADLAVRIVNQTGHKLPTGYPEGRRIWIHVEFRGQNGTIAERGAYDNQTAVLTANDTKVYEAKLGLDAYMAGQTGQPVGESFHFALLNTRIKDNRIPPRGFTNAGFESVQTEPVGATYADGQYWDDTLYAIPAGATQAVVTVYHQTTSKEYIEFLLNENMTNDRGQIAYDEWLAGGMSAPVAMATETIDLAPRLTANLEHISASAGGRQDFTLEAGDAHAGNLYLLAGSFSGTAPGIAFAPGLVLPLNFDLYLQWTLIYPNLPPLVNTFGTLNAQGSASAAFDLPPTVGASLAGLTFHHAYGVLDAGLQVLAFSNPVPLTFDP